MNIPVEVMPGINLADHDWSGNYCLLGWRAIPSTKEPFDHPVLLSYAWRDELGRRNIRFIAEFAEQSGDPSAALRHARHVAAEMNRGLFSMEEFSRYAAGVREEDAQRAYLEMSDLGSHA